MDKYQQYFTADKFAMSNGIELTECTRDLPKRR